MLWLRYEDLQSNLRHEAERVARFLDFELSTADIDRVLPLISMERMQQVEDARRQEFADTWVWRPGSRFFREGAVGNNRARLSQQQQARIVARAREELAPECFEFVMSLGPD